MQYFIFSYLNNPDPTTSFLLPEGEEFVVGGLLPDAFPGFLLYYDVGCLTCHHHGATASPHYSFFTLLSELFQSFVI